jgi:hypothetical protein
MNKGIMVLLVIILAGAGTWLYMGMEGEQKNDDMGVVATSLMTEEEALEAKEVIENASVIAEQEAVAEDLVGLDEENMNLEEELNELENLDF